MVIAILYAFVLTALCLPAVAMLQNNGYKASGIVGLLNTHYFLCVCTLQTFCVAIFFAPLDYLWIALLLVIGVVALYYVLQVSTLKYTPRVIRLLVAIFVINYALCCLSTFVFVVAPVVVLLALVINLPIERAICNYYLATFYIFSINSLN